MARYAAAVLGGLFLCAAGSGAATAQMICGARAEVAASLERNHGERPVAMGLSEGGAVIEVFASARGSFTIVITRPGGPACLMAAGEGWEHLPPLAAGPGA